MTFSKLKPTRAVVVTFLIGGMLGGVGMFFFMRSETEKIVGSINYLDDSRTQLELLNLIGIVEEVSKPSKEMNRKALDEYLRWALTYALFYANKSQRRLAKERGGELLGELPTLLRLNAIQTAEEALRCVEAGEPFDPGFMRGRNSCCANER